MNAELISFLARYIHISEDLAAVFMKTSLIRKFTKGTVLLREGDPIDEAYFVLKGCIRSYVRLSCHVRSDDRKIAGEPRPL